MMIEFVNLIINRDLHEYRNTQYFTEVLFLYLRYSRFLDDDYALDGNSFYEYFVSLLERLNPFFWVILCDRKFSGFVFLDNLIGDKNHIHTAEITTCFLKEYWGDYTKYCAKLFLNFCFHKLKINKLKVQVYPQNSRTKTILRYCGFEKEAFLKNETLKNGQMQDIEIYSIFNQER